MVSRTPDQQRERMAEYRSRPLAARVNAWYSRNYFAALRELARRYPGEFLAVLDRIRDEDPKPGTQDAATGEQAA